MKTKVNHLKAAKSADQSRLWRSLAILSLSMGALLPSARAELPTHDIAAISISAAQTTTNLNDINLTVSRSVNDLRLRTGSNGGDYNVQVGDDALDDAPNGVLMSSVAELRRNNGGGLFSGVSTIADNANGYFIPVFAAAGETAGQNPEFNINVAAAWFPYATWIGGVAKTSGNGNIPLDQFTGSAGLTLGTHIIDHLNGRSTLDLTTLGIDSRTNGVLLVSGAKNESANFALSHVNPTNGTWDLYIKDVGNNTTNTFEQDHIAFVFIPKTNTSVISGRFLGDTTIDMYSGNSPQFTVTNLAVGRYELKIPGRSATNGILIISAEGGGHTNIDNFVSYQPNAANDGWEIQTRDTSGGALEAPAPTDAVVSFVYIPAATPGITANPAGNLVTTEAGGSTNFTVRLDTAPTADVTVTVVSSNPNEGTPSTGSLAFTTTDWNIPQPVTVTGQDDGANDGTVAYNIVLTATAGDPDYTSLAPVNVSALNADNEHGITVAPTSGLTTTEAGGTATFTVRLNTQPSANVTVGLSSGNTTEGTPFPLSLVFDGSDWDQEKTVTVTGANDDVDDGDVTYTIITAPSSSADANYNNINAADVSVVNADNDIAGVVVTPVGGLVVTEAGTTATYTVVLQTQPTVNVSVDVASSDPTEGSVSPSPLTFSPTDWSTPKTVTITGVDDTVQDGSIGYFVTNTFSSSDPVYAGFSPVEVSVTTQDDEGVVNLSGVDTYYAVGFPATSLDGRAAIVDPNTVNYNGGTLTVSLSANGSSNDRLEVRHTGTAPGQISVSGAAVSYGGTPIATFTGGTGTTPLVFSLNASATPTAAEALLRAVTFRTLSTNIIQATRTASVALLDGDGGVSPTVSKSVHVGLVRQSQFQEGADWGYGTYTGAVDIQLHQPDSGTPYPIGHNTNSGLWINWPDAAAVNASHALLRFDNIFGEALGQVPTNAVIVAAELILNVNDAGDASPLYRMLIPWDSETTTWDTFGGVLPNDSTARSVADSHLGLIDGTGSTGLGSVSVSVTPDVIAWASGETNYGWGMPGWFERRDGTGVSPCEDPDIADRPRLRVLWVPAGTLNTSFRQGTNGYNSTFDTRIRQNAPDTNYATIDYVLCDAIVSGSTNNPEQVLIRFDDIIGNGAGQIPAHAQVHAAFLDLASTGGNAMGDGGTFHALLQPWTDTTTTWNSWTNGINTDGVDALATATTAAGYAALAPNVQGGYNTFRVTEDVQAWASGTRSNYGWGILPWPGGGDGWGIGMSESALETDRPRLRVFYSPGSPTVDIVVTSIQRTASAAVIEFAGAANTTYSIRRAATVTGTFDVIGTATTNENGYGTFSDDEALPTTGFYRISNP